MSAPTAELAQTARRMLDSCVYSTPCGACPACVARAAVDELVLRAGTAELALAALKDAMSEIYEMARKGKIECERVTAEDSYALPNIAIHWLSAIRDLAVRRADGPTRRERA